MLDSCLVFGSVRSSRSHNLRPSVRSVLVCLELSSLSFLLRSLLSFLSSHSSQISQLNSYDSLKYFVLLKTKPPPMMTNPQYQKLYIVAHWMPLAVSPLEYSIIVSIPAGPCQFLLLGVSSHQPLTIKLSLMITHHLRGGVILLPVFMILSLSGLKLSLCQLEDSWN